jgi:hypothetical protein
MLRAHLAIAVTFGLLTGCSEFDLKKNIPWGPGEDGKLERPMKLVANWSETVMTNGSTAPMRGFGGRLVFYAHEGGKPVKVAGTLSVYAFDESKGLKDDVVPDRKFVFTEEQFENHYSDKGMLKHSYSFWLPWDELGGERREISLLCRFVSVQGDVVVTEQTRHILPGKPVRNPEIPETLAADHPAVAPPPRQPEQEIQQVGYFETKHPVPLEQRPRMTTSTIMLEDASPALMPQANLHEMRGIQESNGWNGAPGDGTHYQALPPQYQGGFIPSQGGMQAPPQGAPQQPSAHSGPERFQAPRGQVALPTRDRGLWQRPRAGSRSGPATQRSEGPGTQYATNRGSLFPQQR